MIKLVNAEQLEDKVGSIRRAGQNIVTTNGTYDILHRGHILTFQHAKELGYLIVGLNSDDSVKRYKGQFRPINNEVDRAYILSALEYVDLIYIFYW